MRYLTASEVAERYNISRSTVGRLVKSKAIPQPIKLSSRTIRWNSDELDRHDALKAESTQHPMT